MSENKLSTGDQLQIGLLISNLAVPKWEIDPTKEMARLGNNWNEEWEQKERQKVIEKISKYLGPFLEELKTTFRVAQKNKLTSTKNALNIIGSFWVFAFESLDIGTQSLDEDFLQEIIQEAEEGKNRAESGFALLGLELALKKGQFLPLIIEIFDETHSLRIARHLGKISWDKGAVDSLVRATSGPFLRQELDGLSLKSYDGIGLMASLSLLELKDAHGLKGMVSNLLQIKEHFDAAEKLLVQAGEIVVPFLIEGLELQGVNMPQSRAASCLGKIGSKAATKALISALQDQDRRIENEVVIALGKLGDAAAIPVLLQSLSHHSIFVRNSAAKSLRNLKEQWAPEMFIAELVNQDEKVVLLAIEALTEMKSKDAIDPLSRLVSSENKKIRKAAEKAIKVINK